MKKFVIYILLILVSSSCGKRDVSTDFDGTQSALISIKENSKIGIDENNNVVPGTNCYDAYIKANNSSLKTAISMGLNTITNAWLNTEIDDNYDDYIECRNSNPTPVEDLYTQEVEPTTALGTISVTQALNYVNTTTLSGKTYLQILTDAAQYCSDNYPGYGPGIKSRMFYMFNVLDSLGYDELLDYELIGNTMYPKYKVWIALEMTIGARAVPYNIYNQFFALSVEDQVTYPIAHVANNGYTKLTWIYGDNEEFGEIPMVNIVINYDGYLKQYDELEDILSRDQDYPIGASDNFYYNSSNGRLYKDSGFTSFIHDGYYRLPTNHSDKFQLNNYLVKIENGKIVKQYGRSGNL